MKGLELSRAYFQQVGRPALERHVPELLPRMAVGLAGEGSECFGFDDALSRDHDWGPSFCIWLQEEDFAQYGAQVQRVYDALPGDFAGFSARKNGENSRGRVGCLCAQDWYRRYTGSSVGPENLTHWRRIPEAFLATATNGEVFYDPSGSFTAVRERLLDYYPGDVRLKKIVARAARMAQAGQYNYPRCIKRGDTVAAQLALSEFMQAAMSLVYLLNRRYAPFYKWMYRGMRDLPKLTRVGEQLAELSTITPGQEAVELVEGICLLSAAELRRQGLTERTDSFLLALCPDMMEHIHDPQLRQTHIMED